MIILAVVIVAGGFFGGMKYQQSKQSSFAGFGQGGTENGQRTRGGFQNGTGNRNGFRPTTGDIITSDNNSITIKLVDGSSKIILLSDKTNIYKTAMSQKTDLTAGQKVMVMGTDNSDGSTTAQSIQVNPPVRILQSGAPTGTQ